MTDVRQQDGLAKELYDAFVADYRLDPEPHPDRRPPHVRPVHTFGVGAEGYFVPSPVAQRYSMAEHLQAEPRGERRIPVSVRFSNGSGWSTERDNVPDVRGMAVKFRLDEGRETDLIMISLPVFFANTVEQFLGFTRAGIPQPIKVPSWWEQLVNTLRLRPPPTPPQPGDAGVLAYANAHPESRPALVFAHELAVMASYALVEYHALHTFTLTDADGKVRHGRLTLEPVDGVRPIDPGGAGEQFLAAELKERLLAAPARFILRLSLASQGDQLENPAVLWDTTRVRIGLGELFLTGVPDDQVAGCERLSFNPTRTLPGLVGYEGDEILAARRDAYRYSCEQRGGDGCPVGGGA